MAFKGKGSKDMYAKSPKLAQGGKVENAGPTEAEKTANAENGETATMPVHDEMMARHSNDRHVMHAKHEHEHALHKGGDKKEMHSRHEKERKSMHTAHEKEMAAGGEAGTNGLVKE
ncbi:MAG: hypothetical protein WCD70_15195 [Alphaproteobacteria bacterium]